MICNVLVVVPLSTKYVQIHLCFEVKQIQLAPSFISLFEGKKSYAADTKCDQLKQIPLKVQAILTKIIY